MIDRKPLTGVSTQSHSNTLQQGDLAPYFSGIDQHGNFISSDRLRSKGPFIMFFYRGFWCSACQAHLAQFQKDLVKASLENINVVAVTPEQGLYRDMTIARSGVEFSIIHDEYNYIMEHYGVDYVNNNEMSKYVSKQINVSLREVNNQKEVVLPVPATFLVNSCGKINFIHFDKNFKNRASLSDILYHLNFKMSVKIIE